MQSDTQIYWIKMRSFIISKIKPRYISILTLVVVTVKSMSKSKNWLKNAIISLHYMILKRSLKNN